MLAPIRSGAPVAGRAVLDGASKTAAFLPLGIRRWSFKAMRHLIRVAVALGFSVSYAAAMATAQSDAARERSCMAQWDTLRTAQKTEGLSRRKFLKDCSLTSRSGIVTKCKDGTTSRDAANPKIC